MASAQQPPPGTKQTGCRIDTSHFVQMYCGWLGKLNAISGTIFKYQLPSLTLKFGALLEAFQHGAQSRHELAAVTTNFIHHFVVTGE